MRLSRVVALLAAGVAAGGCERAIQRHPTVRTDSESCGVCHPVHYREWSGSMHAYSATSPVFRAMNERGQRETNGELGEFCTQCHAPLGDPQGFAEAATSERVGCVACHAVESVGRDHNNGLRLADDGVFRGPLDDPLATYAHGSAYSPLLDRVRVESATLCGSCHDVVTPGGVRVERTFEEWAESSNSGEACGRCHMQASRDLVEIADVPGAPLRRHHDHSFAAVDVALVPFPEQAAQRAQIDELLARAMQSGLCVSEDEDGARIYVALATSGVGHRFPSGAAQHRRLWTEIVAYRGEPIYQSGVVSASEPVTAGDDDVWLLRDRLFDADGDEVSMLWDAASYASETLPPRQPVQRSYPPMAVAPDRVTLRVRLRPVGRDVLEGLVASGDLDASVADAMPTFDIDLGGGPILEWTPARSRRATLANGTEALCVTDTHLDFSKLTFAE